MSAIPGTDLSAVREYCANRIPPQYQNEVRVECSQHGTNLTIHECRPPWRPDLGPNWARQPVAQLRYNDSDGLWTLYSADRNGHGTATNIQAHEPRHEFARRDHRRPNGHLLGVMAHEGAAVARLSEFKRISSSRTPVLARNQGTFGSPRADGCSAVH